MLLVVDYLIALFFAMLAENTSYESQKRKFGLLSLVTLCITSAFRYYNIEGFDYNIYEGWYTYIPKLTEINSNSLQSLSYESGYFYLMSLCRTIGISFYGFCVITASFFYFALWHGFKKYTKHYGLLTLIFAYKLLFYDTHISMRQPITIAGFFLIMHYIEEKKWMRYYFFTLLLTRFHNGAYLLLFLYPMANTCITKKKFLILNLVFLPTLLVSFTGINVLGPIGTFIADNADTDMARVKANKYFDASSQQEISLFYTIEYFFLSFMVYKYYNKLKMELQDRQLMVKLFLCLLPLFTLFRGSEILTREKDYFTLVYAVLIGYILDLKISTSSKTMIKFFFVLLCIYGYFRLLFGFNGDMLYQEYRMWPFVQKCSFFVSL